VFDIGWTELVVIACVTVLVVGPKELPGLLRSFGKTVGNLRRMAGDFQKQFDDAMREAELDEVRKKMNKPFQPLEDARKAALEFQDKVSSSVKIPPNEPASNTAEAKPVATAVEATAAQVQAQLPASPPPELTAGAAPADTAVAVAERPAGTGTNKDAKPKSKAAAADGKASKAATAKSAAKPAEKPVAAPKSNGAGKRTGKKA
jgi:sec-independent protein translocase protein TatB